MRLNRLVGTALAATLSLSTFSALDAQAAQVGTVPGVVAAQKLTRSMDASMTPADARTDLAALTVAAERDMTGYSRDLFPHWRDASTWGWPVEPNNSCNARNAALYWDGDGVTMSDTCTSLVGRWTDPYSGNVFDLASDIDIDHVVPLAAAWRSGADAWTTDRRTSYANDPLVLVSSWDSLNSAKGDKDPTAWVPPNTASHCLYANRWVQVKTKYGLTVTAPERDKLSSMLSTCSLPYDSAYQTIDAAASPAVKGGTIEADGSTTPLRTGSWTKLGVDFGAAGTAKSVEITYSSGVGSGVSGVLEVHRDSPTGPVIGSTVVTSTSSFDTERTVTVPVSGYTAGRRAVYVTFESAATYPVVEFASLKFSATAPAVPGTKVYRYSVNGVPVSNWSNAKWLTVDSSNRTNPIVDGSWIALPTAFGTTPVSKVTMRYSASTSTSAVVSLRLDSPTGTEVARFTTAPTGADTKPVDLTVPVSSSPVGNRTVYAVVSVPSAGANESAGNLTSFTWVR